MERTSRSSLAGGVILVIAFAFAACGQPPTEEGGAPNSNEVSPKVLKAVAIANAIQADPEKTDAILKEHGMTADSFRDLMYEIAADEKMSADYENARKG